VLSAWIWSTRTAFAGTSDSAPELPVPDPEPPDPLPLDPDPELPDPEPLDPLPPEPDPELPDPEPLEPEPEPLPEPLLAPLLAWATLELMVIEPHPAITAEAIRSEREPAVHRRVFTVLPGQKNFERVLSGLQDFPSRNAGNLPEHSLPGVLHDSLSRVQLIRK